MKSLLQNIISLNPQSDLIDAVCEKLEADGNDYSRNIVIFPNRRPAHFLRRKIAYLHNTPIMPPQIFSIDDFIDFLYEKRYIDVKIEILDAVAILYNLHKNSPNPIGKSGFLDFDMFFPLGLKIFNDIEELYIEKISFYEVKNIDRLIEGMPPNTYSRLQALSYFYENFYNIIQQSGYSTRSLRYRKAIDVARESNFENTSKIILAGFFALTKSEVELFKIILSKDNSLLIFKDSSLIEERLKDIDIPYKSYSKNGIQTQINIYSSPDSHGQIFCLSKLLQDEIKKGVPLDERNLILLPTSENIFPLIHNCLSMLKEDSYNISLGYPLYRTPIYSFFLNLMELIMSITDGKFYVPAYIKFVLHPYIKNIYFDNQPEITRVIFHIIEEELTRQKTIIFLSLDEIENNQHILRKIKDIDPDITEEKVIRHLREIHDNTVYKFTSFKNIGDFAKKCSEILIYIYNNSTAKLHPLFHPYSEAFLVELNKISTSLLRELSFSDINSYFMFFKNYIFTCNVPFEGAPIKGLQILGFLESRNLNFDKIYILDLNENILPSTQKETSLIPFGVRKNLKLPTYIDSDKICEYYFDILVKGAKEVHLFFVENDCSERSRLIEKILWEKQKKEVNLFEPIKKIQYRLTLKNFSPKVITKTDEIIGLLKSFIFSASSLDCYLKCPISFYYRYILKIERKEKVSGDIERSDLGVFVHDFLFNYFKRFKGRRLTKEELDPEKMDIIYNELFEKKFGEKPTGAIYLIKEQTKKHLKELLTNYYIPLSELIPLKILECEHDITVKVHSYNLKGRIDSIEERGSKKVIIDYKISANRDYYKIDFKNLKPTDRDSWQEAIKSLQLPFYILLYSHSNKCEPTDLDAIFLLLGKNIIDKEIELTFFGEVNNSKEKYKILEEIIFKIIREINDFSLPFKPPKNLEKNCKYCDYKSICGV